MFTKHIDLQIKPGGKKPSIRVSQHEEGTVTITLMDGNEQFKIPEKMTVDFNAVLPSGDGFLCSTGIMDGEVEVAVPSLFTEEPGTVSCQLSFWNMGDYSLSDLFTISVKVARVSAEEGG